MTADDRRNREYAADLSAAAKYLVACADVFKPGIGCAARIERIAAKLRDYACIKPYGRLRNFSRN